MTVAQGTPRYEVQIIDEGTSFNYRITDRTTDSRIATSYFGEHADLIVNALNQVAALSAQVVELQKDAERYRWLRDNPDEQLWSLLADINEGPSEEQPEFDNSANAWDAAIDAAIRALPDQKD